MMHHGLDCAFVRHVPAASPEQHRLFHALPPTWQAHPLHGVLIAEGVGPDFFARYPDWAVDPVSALCDASDQFLDRLRHVGWTPLDSADGERYRLSRLCPTVWRANRLMLWMLLSDVAAGFFRRPDWAADPLSALADYFTAQQALRNPGKWSAPLAPLWLRYVRDALTDPAYA